MGDSAVIMKKILGGMAFGIVIHLMLGDIAYVKRKFLRIFGFILSFCGGRWGDVFGALLVLFLLLFFPQNLVASTQNRSIPINAKTLQNDLPGVARFIRDENNVSIIEFSGDYDRGLYAPRKTIGKEFLRAHADVYDFLVVFTSFEFPTISSDGVDARAFYNDVRNDVEGIGLEVFDNSRSFGSEGVLQGYLDMAAITRMSASMSNPNYDSMLSTFAHEVQHRWGSYVRFRDWNGKVSEALLGESGSHWSYPLDSQGSVMYGANWRDNGDGSFTNTEIRSIYSPLDLYLAGMIDKSRVPPFVFVEAANIDATALPPPVGTTIRGIKRTVTVDDIISVEGHRIPSADASQKSFRFAFIYLVRPGEAIDPAQVNVVAQARRQVGLRYNALTHGMGNANVFSEPTHTAKPGFPITILPPGTPDAANPGNNAAGLAWLKIQQKPDGSFMDAAGLAPRDTLLARSYLRTADPVYSGLNSARLWLASQEARNTDFLARKLIESTASERSVDDVSMLLGGRNPDGGWGLGDGLRSNPLDTALALQALRKVNADGILLKPAMDIMLSWQNADGGWGNAPNSPSRVTVTSQSLKALAGLVDGNPDLVKSRRFLKEHQNTDGGFGDGVSSIHDTANVVLAMSEAGFRSDINIATAERFVAESQRLDGSWQGSVYSTVLALQLLGNASSTNLAIESLRAFPLQVFDGQRVTLSAKVINLGTIQSIPSTVRFFDGDPAAGGIPIGEPVAIPALVSGDSKTVQVIWNTTSRAGPHTVFAVVDLEQAIADLNRQDNITSLQLMVQDANQLADLLVADGDVWATPSTISTLPTNIQISALVSNAGVAAVSNAKAVLWRGTGESRIRVADAVFDVAGRATTGLQFQTMLSEAGATVYTVELDPEGLVNEATRSNNSASVTLRTTGGVSLSVNKSDITISPEKPRPGADVAFTVRLLNAGTLDSTSFNVRYSIRSQSGTIPMLTNVVQIAAGAAAEQQIAWRAGQGGSYSFVVEMDPEKKSGDENTADNVAIVDFDVAATSGLNLAVSYKDLSFAPTPALEGYNVAVSAVVRNVGDIPSSSFNVQFHDGDPEAGGVSIGVARITAVPPDGEATATVNWEVPTAAERLVFVSVDPEHVQTGEITLEDNIAFKNIKVLTLPDFAISQGAITLTPSIPKPGEVSTLSVVVSNLGEQAASNVVVSAFIGGDDSGVKLAPDVVLPSVEGKANSIAHFEFNAPASSGLGFITVVVNPSFTVKERIRTNNSAKIPFGTQEGNFALSEAYISPNGDGVKDSTVLSYRLPAAMPVSIQVRDASGRLVRTTALKASESSGSWQWDGLDDDGRLVQDGRYDLTVRNMDGVIMGGDSVEVDTNRSSLLSAIGSSYGTNTRLTCNFPSASRATSIPDGAGFYIDVPTARDVWEDLPAGIYRIDDWGRGLRKVLGGLLERADSDVPSRWDSFVTNNQGTHIVAYNREKHQLVSAGGEGEERRVIYNKHIQMLAGLANEDKEVIVTADDGGLNAINITTGAQRDLGVSSVNGVQISSDGSRLIAKSADDGDVLIDLIDGNRKILDGEYYWTPSGDFLVANLHNKFILLDKAGNAYREIEIPFQSGNEAWADDSSELYVPMVQECRGGGDIFRECPVVIRRIDIRSGRFVDLTAFMHKIEPNGDRLYVDLTAIPGRNEVLAHSYPISIEHRYAERKKSKAAAFDDDNSDYRVIGLRDPVEVTGVLFGDAPPTIRVGSALEHAWNESDFIEYGRGLIYRTSLSSVDGSSCGVDDTSYREDAYVFRSLANLQIDLVLSRRADGNSVKVHGGVADKNFARYWLEYASDDAPDVWHPILAAESTAVWNKDLTTWAAPGVGRYALRMTAEDLAGNKKQKLRRITIAEAGPPITNILREPAYISPNGDGSNDEMRLSYRVLEPVHLEFSIFNRQGVLVRTISRDHPVGAIDANILWDGRDNNGQIVVDGEYRINVVGFDFFVTVDNAVPIIHALSNSEPFSVVDGSMIRTTVLRGSVSDVNFKSVQLEIGDGVSPSKWRSYRTSLSVIDSENKINKEFSVYLPLVDYVDRRFRLVVVDLAGNRTVQQFEPSLEDAKILLIGQIMANDLPDGEIHPNPGESLRILYNSKAKQLRPAAGIALVFAETLNDPIVSVSIQFNELALAEKGEWLEQPNVQVYPIYDGMGIHYLNNAEKQIPHVETVENSVLDESGAIPQNYGMVAFFNKNISVEQGVSIRLKLVGRSGLQYLTDAVAVYDNNYIGFKRGFASVGSLEGVLVLKTAGIARSLEVFASSDDDPNFSIERKIHSQSLNSVVPPSEFYFSREGRYVSCARYKLRAEVVLEDNRRKIETTMVALGCGGVQFKVRPNFTACDEPAMHQWHVFATPEPGDAGRVPLVTFEVYVERPDGGRQLIFNVVDPKYQDYEFTFEHGSFPEGDVTLLGITTDRDGVQRSSRLAVPIDHTPASLRITYPQENQRVCGIPESHRGGAGVGEAFANVLRPIAEIEDAAGFDYALNFELPDGDQSWQPVEGRLPSIYGPDPTDPPDWNDSQLPYEKREFLRSSKGKKDRSYMTGRRIAGELGPIVNISGPVAARVVVYDWSGARSCRQVNFYLDGTVDVDAPSVDMRLFSPGTTSSLSSVSLAINPMEPVSVTVDVRRVVVVNDQRSLADGIIRRIVNKLPVLAGQREIVWDGKDDAGHYVLDGEYTFDISYEDGCGNKKVPRAGPVLDTVRRSLIVQVDRTPPDLQINKPAAGNVTSSFLDVIGSIKDKNLLQWVLEYSTDKEPDIWTIIASRTKAVDLQKLAVLDATMPRGTITLRLRASDKVELSSEAVRVLRTQDPIALIRKFEASPYPFSPNGDGRLDTSRIVYDVFQPVEINLTIKRGGVVVRKLLSQVFTTPGERTVMWDGKNSALVPALDGEYILEIKAISSADPTNIQTEETSVLLDTTAPQFTLKSELRPFLPGNAAFIGSIADLTLNSYQVYIVGPLPGTKQLLLAEGSQTFANTMLGSLDQLGLDDARYRIRVVANDEAENYTDFQSTEFEIDSKAPVVSFSNPVSGTFVSRARPADISGAADDINLLSVELAIKDQRVLAAPVASSPTAVLFPFDGSTVPDGIYPTQLIGTDRAGNVGVANTSINVDNTPPTAVITVPAANAAIGTRIAVIGTASDVNMESWKLEIGSGVGQSLDGLTVINRGTGGIQNRELGSLIGLPPDGPATLRLTVLDKGGNTSIFDVPLQIDTTPPNAPVLSGRREQRSDARLNWTATNESSRISGYNLYRNDIRVNAAPLSGMEYLDVRLLDGSYAYAVAALSHSGLESPRSNTVTININERGPTAQITKPTHHTSVSGVVSIEGSAFASMNFRAYEVAVGAGETPTTWTVLRTSALPIQGGVLSNWSTVGLPEGAIYSIRLTAEDIQGGVSTAVVVVSIDNLAPAKPMGLQAQLSGSSDVVLNWIANTESDLAGYLLYRDGQLVNQIDLNDNSIRPYLLNAATYLDKALPDGTFVYTVVAVDQAENQSSRSDPASVLVDNRTPQATIIQPVDGANVDGVVYVRAVSPDKDIASVRFEYKPASASTWTPIGTSNKTPYSTNWDTNGLADGGYQLRAVATDLAGHTDPVPPTIAVTRKNLQRPLAPSELTALVDGGTVTLNWTASGSSNVRGYHVQRSDAANADSSSIRLTSTMIASTTFVDIDRPDGNYRYQVLSVNSDDNESDPSSPAVAVVYSVYLKQPYTPVASVSSPLKGNSPNATDAVAITVVPESGATVSQSAVPDASGEFSSDAVPLEKGGNGISARQTDPQGNHSKVASVRVARGDLPAPPDHVTAAASGSAYLVTWTPSSSTDLAGYVVQIDGKPMPMPFNFVDATASSSAGGYASADRAIDSYDYTYWQPAYKDTHASIELRAAGKELITELSILWNSYVYQSPMRFSIEAWDGFVWVPLKEEQANSENSLQLLLDPPYYTDRIRISIGTSEYRYQAPTISNVKGKSLPVVVGTSQNMSVGDGIHTVSVRALSTLGLLGTAASSSPSGIGDYTPPPPVEASVSVSGARATVSWSESEAPDVEKYEVLRDGAVIASVLASEPREHVDGPLANGLYTYTVRPIDRSGNVGQLSNDAVASIASAVPGAPLQLTLEVPPAGGELRLHWAPPTSGGTAASYALYRAEAVGGPYVLLDETGFEVLTYADATVINGIRYYYVVRARDVVGNEGASSNEVSGVALDRVAPLAPAIFYPTDSDHPLSVDHNSTSVRAFAEPGAQVTLSRDGTTLSMATALAATQSIPVASVYRNWVKAPHGDRFAYLSDGALVIKRLVVGLDGSISPTIERVVPQIDGWSSLAWSPDAEQIALSNGYDSIKIVRVGDGSVSDRVSDAPIDTLAWHADGKRLIATAHYGAELLEIQADSGASRSIATASHEFSAYAASPGGQHVAIVDGSELKVLSLSDGTSSPVMAPDLVSQGPLAWTPDGKSLYFAGRDSASWDRQVYRVKIGDGPPIAVTSEANGVDDYAISPAGALAFISGDQLHVWDGTNTVAIEGAIGLSAYRLQWAKSGVLFIEGGGSITSNLLPGTTIFPPVQLKAGENLLSAHAFDAAGNVGPKSKAISVTYSTQQNAKPDFSVQAADLSVVPQVPKVGVPARITLVVNNQGAADAPAVGVRMLAIAPGGTRIELLNTRSAAIAAGGSQVFRADTAFAAVGDWQLSVAVDAADEVDEVSEDNNFLALPVHVVDADAARTVAVSLDKATYPVGATLSASAMLFNGQADIAGQLNLSIEDEQGYSVATLPVQNQPLLPYGQSRTVDFSWTVPAIFDAPYKVRAVWTHGNTVLAQSTAAFLVQPHVQVSAKVSSDSSSYALGNMARIVAQIDPAGTSPTTSTMQASIQVRNAGGNSVLETTDTVGLLSPAQLAKTLDTRGLALGTYSVELSGKVGGQDVAHASTAFDIVAAASPVAALAGDIVLDRSSTPYTGDISGTVILTNIGETDLGSFEYEVDVIDPRSGTVLARWVNDVASLARGTETRATFSFPAVGMPIGTLWIQLRTSLVLKRIAAKSGLNPNLLRQREIALFELDPPTVVIKQPVEGAYLRAAQSVLAAATDLLSGVRQVEFQVNGGAWRSTALADPVSSNYAGVLPQLSDGMHRIAVRATDKSGNVSQPVHSNFVVDSVAPVITVTGVAEAAYTNAVTPVVAVTDQNLSVTQIRLNGSPYVSGTQISQTGAYVLQVDAIDLAGNTASQMVRFSIAANSADTTPPVIDIKTPLAGAYLRRGTGGLTATVVDAESAIAAAEFGIDGGVFAPMAIDASQNIANLYAASLDTLADGAYSVVVRARDTQGNEASTSARSFTVDNTPPVITITGVTAGQYSAAVTPVITVTDAALLGSSATLNGAVYASGTPISINGDYTLSVSAVDKAGNTATATLQFSMRLPMVDDTPPAVFIEQPIEGAHIRRGALLVVSATDTGSGVAGVEQKLDAQPQWAGMGVSATTGKYTLEVGNLPDGLHAASVRATDNAGNTSDVQVRHFTVDNTAPSVQVSGIANDGKYPGSASAAIAISDLHLSSSSSTLNGSPYVSGSPIAAPGLYTLTVAARDIAGNETIVSVTFEVTSAGANGPSVAITEPSANAIVKSGVLLVASVQPFGNVARLEMAIGASTIYTSMQPRGSGVYDIPVPHQADGPVTLRVRAVDLGGVSHPAVAHVLTMDNTPPVIDQLSVLNGGRYPIGHVIAFQVTDAHLQSVVSTLDGQPFSPGQRVSSTGEHQLHITARDQAGNETQQILAFVATAALQEPAQIPLWPMNKAALALMYLAIVLVARAIYGKTQKR